MTIKINKPALAKPKPTADKQTLAYAASSKSSSPVKVTIVTDKPECQTCYNTGYEQVSEYEIELEEAGNTDFCPDCILGSKLEAAHTKIKPHLPTLSSAQPETTPTLHAKPALSPLKPSIIPLAIKLSTPKVEQIAHKAIAIAVPKIPIAEQVGRVIDGLVDQQGKPITIDKDQAKAVELAISGSSCCVVGKAGTGKTTTVQAISLSWLEHTKWHIASYRQQGTGDRFPAPSIAIVAFTNRAANNMASRLVSHHKLGRNGFGFGPNITTVHNLLEYTVEFIIDSETGNKKPHYYPMRDSLNKLNITHLVIEEATLIGVGDNSLWNQLLAALPKGVQILFLGDINQLPPVIGKSILNYAVQQLPRVELTKPHRQALDNPIIRQALNCIEGKPIVEDFNPETGLGVRIFNGKAKHKMHHQEYELALKRLVGKLIDADQFDPMVDMVLSPYNKLTTKAVSSCNIANSIATLLAARGDTPVYEVRAGFALKYFRIGDRVFVDKKEGIISEINHNVSYFGKSVRPASDSLDYFGEYSNSVSAAEKRNGEVVDDDWDFDYDGLSIEDLIEKSEVDEEERKRAASHTITVTFPAGEDEDGRQHEDTYSAVGDVANIMLGYALSVHKSQGSEWPRVIIALHHTNATNLFRELVYTAMTRPKARLDIVAQAQVLEKATKNQRIKGATLEAKIEFFNSGYLDQEVQLEP